MNSIILKVLLSLLPMLVTAITPELRALLVKCIADLDEKAKQTATPFDDALVSVLKVLLGL